MNEQKLRNDVPAVVFFMGLSLLLCALFGLVIFALRYGEAGILTTEQKNFVFEVGLAVGFLGVVMMFGGLIWDRKRKR